MARSPLTESIQKVRRLVLEIQNTLTVDEFNLLLDELIPEPEPKKPTKKASKKSSKSSSSKSPRATGIERQLRERRERGPQAMTYCAHVFSGGEKCGESESSGIHDVTMGYQNYHPFVSEFAVPTAPTRSPANGEATTSTANSEIAKDAASTVAHGTGGGD